MELKNVSFCDAIDLFNESRKIDVKDFGERPWDFESIIRMYRKNFSQTRKIVKSLPGFNALESIIALKRIFWFLNSFSEEIVEKQESVEFLELDGVLDQSEEVIRVKIDEINKSFFSFVNAATALRDVQRRVQKKYISNKHKFEANKKEIFEEYSDLVEFVKEFRNCVVHYYLPSLKWRVHCDLEKGTRSNEFYFDREDLLSSGYDWKKQSKVFIGKFDSLILHEISSEYCSLARRFNEYLIEEIEKENDCEIQEYLTHEKFLYCLSNVVCFPINMKYFEKINIPPLTDDDIQNVLAQKTLCEQVLELQSVLEVKYSIDITKRIFGWSI